MRASTLSARRASLVPAPGELAAGWTAARFGELSGGKIRGPLQLRWTTENEQNVLVPKSDTTS